MVNKKLLVCISILTSYSFIQAEMPVGANRETTSETFFEWAREVYRYWTAERVKTPGALLLGLVINGKIHEQEFESESFSMYDTRLPELIAIRDSFADRTCCVGPMGNLPQFRSLVNQDPAWQTLAVRYSLPSGIIKTEQVNVKKDFIEKQRLVVELFELLRYYGTIQ